MSAKLETLSENLGKHFGDKIKSLKLALGEITLEVGAADYLGVMTALRDEADFRFEEMVDLCGVDYSTYGDGAWQGFISKNRLDVTVDMENETTIHSVTAAFMQVVGAEVFLPASVVISVSDDGVNFTELKHQDFVVNKEEAIKFSDVSWEGTVKGRYVRYQARAGKELGGWIFTDEIIVK